jgi:hypothetical protein
MKTIRLFLTLLLLATVVISCKKKEETKPVSVQLQYGSLAAESTTVAVNATTKITATASGEGLTYNWSASNGTVVGSGSQITFGTPCCAGTPTVTCVVKDSGGNQESKSVVITVQ